MLTHSGQKPYKCPHCPIRFTTKSNCERHLIRKHERSSSSIGRSSLSWNLHQKKAAARAHCVCCSRSFGSETLLKDHLHHSQAEKPFRCVMCCQVFARAIECAQHAEDEHALRMKPEKSDDCPQVVEGLACFVCYQRVGDAVALRTHFKTSHGLDGNNNTNSDSANSPFSKTHTRSGTKGTLTEEPLNDDIHVENRRIAVSAS